MLNKYIKMCIVFFALNIYAPSEAVLFEATLQLRESVMQRNANVMPIVENALKNEHAKQLKKLDAILQKLEGSKYYQSFMSAINSFKTNNDDNSFRHAYNTLNTMRSNDYKQFSTLDGVEIVANMQDKVLNQIYNCIALNVLQKILHDEQQIKLNTMPYKIKDLVPNLAFHAKILEQLKHENMELKYNDFALQFEALKVIVESFDSAHPLKKILREHIEELTVITKAKGCLDLVQEMHKDVSKGWIFPCKAKQVHVCRGHIDNATVHFDNSKQCDNYEVIEMKTSSEPIDFSHIIDFISNLKTSILNALEIKKCCIIQNIFRQNMQDKLNMQFGSEIAAEIAQLRQYSEDEYNKLLDTLYKLNDINSVVGVVDNIKQTYRQWHDDAKASGTNAESNYETIMPALEKDLDQLKQLPNLVALEKELERMEAKIEQAAPIVVKLPKITEIKCKGHDEKQENIYWHSDAKKKEKELKQKYDSDPSILKSEVSDVEEFFGPIECASRIVGACVSVYSGSIIGFIPYCICVVGVGVGAGACTGVVKALREYTIWGKYYHQNNYAPCSSFEISTIQDASEKRFDLKVFAEKLRQLKEKIQNTMAQTSNQLVFDFLQKAQQKREEKQREDLAKQRDAALQAMQTQMLAQADEIRLQVPRQELSKQEETTRGEIEKEQRILYYAMLQGNREQLHDLQEHHHNQHMYGITNQRTTYLGA